VEVKVKVRDLLDKGFQVVAGHGGLENPIEGVYICDLLSWVMAKSKPKNAWITIQSHVSIVAVALMVEQSCIIVSEGVEVEKEAVERANEEGMPILSFSGTSYEAAIKLYHLLSK